MEEENAIIEWLQGSGITIGAIIVGVWLFRKFGMMIISKAIRKAIKPDDYASEMAEQRREDTLITVVGAVVRIGLYAVAAMMIFSELGVDIGPLVAGASVIGVAIGFGAQSLIKDFVSGLFIIMENQYRVGDVVEMNGVSGSVQDITIRTTILRDLDGNEHHIPNGSFDVATNKTMLFSRINLNIGVSYDSDIEKVKKVVNKVGSDMLKDEPWKDHIEEAPAFVRVNNFGASEVEVKILGKVKPGKQWSVAGEFRSRLKKAFDKAGIEIPYPQLDIHQKKK